MIRRWFTPENIALVIVYATCALFLALWVIG